MPRKGDSRPKTIGPDWYLVEWMRAKKVTQAELGRATGWSKATVNDIYHGKTKYYREIVNEVAQALHIQPYELLMPPELANAIKQQQKIALTVVETARSVEGIGSNVKVSAGS